MSAVPRWRARMLLLAPSLGLLVPFFLGGRGDSRAAELAATDSTLPASPEAAPHDEFCSRCDTTGREPFDFPRDTFVHEGLSHSCSVLFTDEDGNFGIDFLPCSRCAAPQAHAVAEDDYQAELARRRKWVEDRRVVDRFLDDRRLTLMHCSTEHFDLVWSIPKIKVGRRVLRQHEAMHLYADRLQRVYDRYLSQFRLDHVEDQNGVRHTIMCFELARHAQRGQPEYTGIGGFAASGAKLVGDKSVFVCYWNKNENPRDREFHEYVVHNAVHMFLASSWNYEWLAREHGWVDAGFSHYFTEQIFENCRTHCFEEQDAMSGWELDPWRVAVRKRVAMKKDLPVFVDTARKKTEILTADEHLFAWSWVQFLIDAHTSDQWVEFLKILKEKRPMRDALREVYGMSPFSFVDRWKEYVLENYPPR